MNDFNYIDYSEMMRDARRGLEREREELEEKVTDLNNFLKMMEVTDEILADRDRWQQEAEQLREQLQESNEREAKLEMQLKEMQKLSASVAGKASQDELLKALSTFVKKSKQKRLEKRVAVKEMVLELANANGLILPQDLAASIDSLDDEQIVEPSPVTTTGNVTEDMSVLFSAETQVLWQRLRDAGFIMADGYALAEGVSANQAAYIADRMAEKLQIKKKWKLFQQLWGIPNLAQLAGTWQQTGKLPPRSSEIDKLTK